MLQTSGGLGEDIGSCCDRDAKYMVLVWLISWEGWKGPWCVGLHLGREAVFRRPISRRIGLHSLPRWDLMSCSCHPPSFAPTE
jgi:hypothetical protein